MGQKRLSFGGSAQFALLPISFLEQIDTLSPAAIEVYLILVKHADRKGESFPSRGRIAEMVGKSTRTISRAISELVARGFISVDPRFRNDGGQSSSNYVIHNFPGADHQKNDQQSHQVNSGERSREDPVVPSSAPKNSPRERKSGSVNAGQLNECTGGDMGVKGGGDMGVTPLNYNQFRTMEENRVLEFGYLVSKKERTDFYSAVQAGFFSATAANLFRFLACIEHAKENGDDPEKLLRWIIANRAWTVITDRDEDAVRLRQQGSREQLPTIGQIIRSAIDAGVSA